MKAPSGRLVRVGIRAVLMLCAAVAVVAGASRMYASSASLQTRVRDVARASVESPASATGDSAVTASTGERTGSAATSARTPTELGGRATSGASDRVKNGKPKDKTKPPKSDPPVDPPDDPVDPPDDPVDPPDDPVDPDPPAVAPGVPTLTACTSGDMADVVAFDPAAEGGPVAAFSLLRAATSDGTYSVVATAGPEARSFTYPVAECGTAYYAVSAEGPGGASSPSGAAQNARVSISGEVTPAGRVLRASNGEVALALAPGSYAETTTVTVEELAGTPTGPFVALAGIYDIEPSGSLGAPATLSIAYALDVEQAQIVSTLLRAAGLMTYDTATASWVRVADARLEGSYLTGELSHFSPYTNGTYQPHGTSGLAVNYCDDVCHDLQSPTNADIRLDARDAQVCYFCHGNEPHTASAAGVPGGRNIEAEFFDVLGQTPLPATRTTHPVGQGLYCTSCHDPHKNPYAAGNEDLLRAFDAVSGAAVTGGDAFCWTCHGIARNRRVAANILLFKPSYDYFTATGGDRKTGYDPGDLASAEMTGGVTCAACHHGHGSDQDGLIKATMGPFTPEGTPTHAGVSHEVAGPCISSGCHVTDASVIHAAIGCQACHATGTTTSFACRSCHAGDQHPTANHVNAPSTQCDACHAETNLMSVHGDDCGRCHSTGANLTYSGGCAQSGCHSATHVDAWGDYWEGHSVFGVAHSDYGGGTPPDSCWSCHANNGEISLGAACTTPYCHPDVYERVAPTTTSNAVAAYTGVAQIDLTPIDAGTSGIVSGVLDTFYRINGGPLEKGVSILIIPPASGTRDYTVEFWSIDANLNTEAPHFVSFTVSAGGTLDPTAPSGSMSVNAGAGFTASRTASVGSSVIGASSMRIDPGTGQWGGWMPYTASRTITISGDGVKTVRVEYRSSWGVTTVLADTITLDTTGPSGSLSVNGGSAWTEDLTVTLSPNATDALAGVADMRFSNDGSSWSSWQPYAPTTTWTLTSGYGTKTVYAQYRDALGNTSSVVQDAIAYFVGSDTTPPTGSIQINGTNTYTQTPAVTLTLTASDSQTGVAEMRLSDDGSTWNAWEPYTPTKAWALVGGYGLKYVYVQYKDGQGNASTTRNDYIRYDAAPPTGSITIDDADGTTNTRAVAMTVSATDTGSSQLRYVRFSNDGSTWGAWEDWASVLGDATTMERVWTLSPGDGAKTVYVQFCDNAGNVSTTYSDSTAYTGEVNGMATLWLRWGGPLPYRSTSPYHIPEGYAELHVENSAGETIASTAVSGTGDQLAWIVAVPAGQDYYLVCDYYYDDWDPEEGGPYGIWSNNTAINPDGVLAPGEVVIWNY